MAVRFNQMAVLLLLLTAATLWQCSSAATYVVGDSLGWTVPPNPSSYSVWASTKTFVVGDILVFNFASGRHDVAEVTKSALDSCSGGNPISVENNSPARITLTSAGDRHFICNFPGHCNGGQKLSITVRATSSPAPQPSIPALAPTPVSVSSPTLAPEPSSAGRSPSPAPTPTPVSTPSIAPEPTSSGRSPSPAPNTPPSSSVVPSPAPSREPTTYVVGGSSGWTVPTNGAAFYESWARDKNFHVGDVLEFNFVSQTHDVAEVTEQNFDSCSGESPRSRFTNPPVRITLSEAGEHFYICTFTGHCGFGQKLGINVTGDSATTSPPSIATPPSTDGSVPSTQSPTTAPPPPSSATSLRAFGFSAALSAVAIALLF